MKRSHFWPYILVTIMTVSDLFTIYKYGGIWEPISMVLLPFIYIANYQLLKMIYRGI
jgi:hypothetical protein